MEKEYCKFCGEDLANIHTWELETPNYKFDICLECSGELDEWVENKLNLQNEKEVDSQSD